MRLLLCLCTLCSCRWSWPVGQCCFHLSPFFFNDPATTEIYTLSLHDALPISNASHLCYKGTGGPGGDACSARDQRIAADRKSTRLNSSHLGISYAVFCLKKKTITSAVELSLILSSSRS